MKEDTEMIVDEREFLCERRLKALSPALHTCYCSSVFAMDCMLTNYKTIFPFYTNHTFEHSAQVIRYCNIIAGAENVDRLSADELYILLMGAALHDVGMGVSEADFDDMKNSIPGCVAYIESNPRQAIGEYARAFHQEFSARLIRKYRDLFEIPSEGYLYGICQVARGHRKLDLCDPGEFPDYTLENGHTVRLSYIAALVKLADELDITADRNLLFDYSNSDGRWSDVQRLCYACHHAIRSLTVEEDALTLHFSTDDPEVFGEIMSTEGKVQKTFGEFVRVVDRYPEFGLSQHTIRFAAEAPEITPTR